MFITGCLREQPGTRGTAHEMGGNRCQRERRANTYRTSWYALWFCSRREKAFCGKLLPAGKVIAFPEIKVREREGSQRAELSQRHEQTCSCKHLARPCAHVDGPGA